MDLSDEFLLSTLRGGEVCVLWVGRGVGGEGVCVCSPGLCVCVFSGCLFVFVFRRESECVCVCSPGRCVFVCYVCSPVCVCVCFVLVCECVFTKCVFSPSVCFLQECVSPGEVSQGAVVSLRKCFSLRRCFPQGCGFLRGVVSRGVSVPWNCDTRVEPHLFRVSMLRRLRLPFHTCLHMIPKSTLFTTIAQRVSRRGCWQDEEGGRGVGFSFPCFFHCFQRFLSPIFRSCFCPSWFLAKFVLEPSSLDEPSVSAISRRPQLTFSCVFFLAPHFGTDGFTFLCLFCRLELPCFFFFHQMVFFLTFVVAPPT